MLKRVIEKLLRQHGLIPLLQEIIYFVRRDDSDPCQNLADDLQKALNKYKKNKGK